MSRKVNGPRITVKLSCFDCRHCESESYAVQGDSGMQVYCCHPSAVSIDGARRIGDSDWQTPMWCPFLAAYHPHPELPDAD